MIAAFEDVVFLRSQMGDQIIQSPAAACKHGRIRIEQFIITDQAQKCIFSAPDIPFGKLFFHRIGTDAAIRGLTFHHFCHRIINDFAQLRISGHKRTGDRRTDDFSPEFAAPAAVTFTALHKGGCQQLEIHLLEPVGDRFLQRLSGDAPENILSHVDSLY